MSPIPTYCITLPEQPERKQRAIVHFREVGLEPRFVDGIHAERFGLKTVFPYELDNPGSNYNMGFGRVGCWLSHYTLWAALNLMWDDIFLVVEDDAKFPPDWHPRTMNALRDAPADFDMLFIGSCCCEGKPKTSVTGEVFAVEWPLCTHAYIVARKALPVILATQRKCYAPIDISLALHTMPKLKVYTVLPRIVEQFDTIIPP